MMKKLVFMAMLAVLCFPGQSIAGTTLYPAENPNPNGAYILCVSNNPGDCYELRDTFNSTNTQVEHVADLILLRTGGTGFMQTETDIIPLSWTAPSGNLVRISLEDGKNTSWDFIPEGAFLQGPKNFIFVRSEREYDDTEGGEIMLP